MLTTLTTASREEGKRQPHGTPASSPGEPASPCGRRLIRQSIVLAKKMDARIKSRHDDICGSPHHRSCFHVLENPRALANAAPPRLFVKGAGSPCVSLPS
jgi:hypothetical protein